MCLWAVPSAPAGNTYTPISAGTWSGSGIYEAMGGTWNSTSHQFTVSAAQAGTAGTPVAIDLSQQQRVLVSGAMGAEVGASFQAATSPTPITFTASPATGPAFMPLADLLPSDDPVMSAWTCSATGYPSGSPAYLSLAGTGNGGGFCADSLEVWTYSGGTWSPFATSDLTYDGTFASFTVTSFGTYAVTGVAVMPGDANRDGRVDINDLTVVLSDWGRTGATWTQGDFNGDGKVDLNDLSIVVSNYGATY